MVKGIAWREDVSNADRKYKRNAVRLDLVPVMTDLAGGTEALANRFKSLSYQSHKLKDWINFEVCKPEVESVSCSKSPFYIRFRTWSAWIDCLATISTTELLRTR